LLDGGGRGIVGGAARSVDRLRARDVGAGGNIFDEGETLDKETRQCPCCPALPASRRPRGLRPQGSFESVASPEELSPSPRCDPAESGARGLGPCGSWNRQRQAGEGAGLRPSVDEPRRSFLHFGTGLQGHGEAVYKLLKSDESAAVRITEQLMWTAENRARYNRNDVRNLVRTASCMCRARDVSGDTFPPGSRTNPGIICKTRSILYKILRRRQPDAIPRDRSASAL
jgi:hypothetical protein